MNNNLKYSAFNPGTVTYVDFDLSFRQNPLTDDLAIRSDEEAIKQSLKNILLTQRGEKPFQPDFGAGLDSLLFEQLNRITKSVAENKILAAIENEEPRVRITNINIDSNYDRGELSVKIFYNILNVISPQMFEVMLKRTR